MYCTNAIPHFLLSLSYHIISVISENVWPAIPLKPILSTLYHHNTIPCLLNLFQTHSSKCRHIGMFSFAFCALCQQPVCFRHSSAFIFGTTHLHINPHFTNFCITSAYSNPFLIYLEPLLIRSEHDRSESFRIWFCKVHITGNSNPLFSSSPLILFITCFFKIIYAPPCKQTYHFLNSLYYFGLQSTSNSWDTISFLFISP